MESTVKERLMKLMINEEKKLCQVLSLKIIESDKRHHIINIVIVDFGRKFCKKSKDTCYYDSNGTLKI